jgi:DNA primase
MTRMTDESDREAVRNATDLARLIGEHVALRPQGREFIGLCPFHDDRKPSFHVVPHKGSGFYKCFACGASGDCFRFVMEFHKMEFGQALAYLAERAGITLSPRSGQSSSEVSGRALLKKINASAASHFQKMLRDENLGSEARSAIRTRGYSDETVSRFQIGAAPPGFDRLCGRLTDRPDLLKAALDAGIVRERDGRTYDTFRHRLMFPIHDELGEPIAFGGRILDPDDTPKYLNSPESPLFSKSRTLYALHLARRSMLQHRTAIVTEGYTDVIACHQAGFENVVATLGTALTTEHAAILRRFCDTVILLFDGDEAGRKAADRGIEVLLPEPVDIRICVLPDRADPDDLLRQPDGASLFAAALEQSRDAIDYLLDRFRTRIDAEEGIGAR